MKGRIHSRSSREAMSLVEVAIAVGIISFVLVSMLALFPTMLKSMRESREKVLVQRMYQTVAEDLHENPVAAGQERQYTFDEEGFLLGVDPPRQGQVFRSGTARFTGTATDNVVTSLVAGVPNEFLVLSRIQLTDTLRKSTLLHRPVWTTYTPYH